MSFPPRLGPILRKADWAPFSGNQIGSLLKETRLSTLERKPNWVSFKGKQIGSPLKESFPGEEFSKENCVFQSQTVQDAFALYWPYLEFSGFSNLIN